MDLRLWTFCAEMIGALPSEEEEKKRSFLTDENNENNENDENEVVLFHYETARKENFPDDSLKIPCAHLVFLHQRHYFAIKLHNRVTVSTTHNYQKILKFSAYKSTRRKETISFFSNYYAKL